MEEGVCAYALLSVDGLWCDAECEEFLAVGTDTTGLKTRGVVESCDDGFLLLCRNLHSVTSERIRDWFVSTYITTSAGTLH